MIKANNSYQTASERREANRKPQNNINIAKENSNNMTKIIPQTNLNKKHNDILALKIKRLENEIILLLKEYKEYLPKKIARIDDNLQFYKISHSCSEMPHLSWSIVLLIFIAIGILDFFALKDFYSVILGESFNFNPIVTSFITYTSPFILLVFYHVGSGYTYKKEEMFITNQITKGELLLAKLIKILPLSVPIIVCSAYFTLELENFEYLFYLAMLALLLSSHIIYLVNSTDIYQFILNKIYYRKINKLHKDIEKQNKEKDNVENTIRSKLISCADFRQYFRNKNITEPPFAFTRTQLNELRAIYDITAHRRLL